MNKLCGIDEAGRGPLAGPLVVAGCVINKSIEGLNDSKVLSEKKREALFDEIKEKTSYHIVFSSALDIDTKGISACIRDSIKEIMQNLDEYSDEFLQLTQQLTKLGKIDIFYVSLRKLARSGFINKIQRESKNRSDETYASFMERINEIFVEAGLVEFIEILN